MHSELRRDAEEKAYWAGETQRILDQRRDPMKHPDDPKSICAECVHHRAVPVLLASVAYRTEHNCSHGVVGRMGPRDPVTGKRRDESPRPVLCRTKNGKGDCSDFEAIPRDPRG